MCTNCENVEADGCAAVIATPFRHFPRRDVDVFACAAGLAIGAK